MVDVVVGQALEAIPDFAKGQVFFLKAADETEPGEVAFVIVGAGAAGFGCGEEALLDVITDSPRGDVGGGAELGEVEWRGKGHHGSNMTLIRYTVNKRPDPAGRLGRELKSSGGAPP